MANEVAVPPPPMSDAGQHGHPAERCGLAQQLRCWAAEYGERVAIVDDRSCTYAQLDQRVDRLAAGLSGLGVRPRDVVLLQLPNSTAFVVALFALMRIGARPLVAMPSQRLADLRGLCEQAEAVACVVPDRFLGFDHRDMARALRQRCPSLTHVIVDGETDTDVSLDALETAALDRPPTPDSNPDDIALLLQSGGTTGTPKLIPRTHADYAYNARASAALCGLSADTVYLAALPLAHNFPLACPGLLGTLSVGGRVVMARTPSTDETFPLIARERVSVTALVPALVSVWLQARQDDDSDLSSLRLLQVGGARLDPNQARQIRPSFDCQLQQVFGMAEGLLCFTRPDDPEAVVHHTQGRPLSPDDEVRIVDADGVDVAPGEVGELLTRGPYTIHGYFRADPAANAAFTRDGFYRSGDLVRCTTEGNFVVEGRVKEQINRAGEKIATAEIEAQLCAHPDVEDAAVVAVADPELGERSCAFVICRDETPSLADVHAFFQARALPRYKWPDQLETTPAWPLTKIGKIDKRRLAESVGNAAEAEPDPVVVFRERSITITQAPLTLAARIARSLADKTSFTVYERRDEWSIGIGVHAEIRIDAEQVHLDQNGTRRTWPLTDFPATMAQVVSALSVKGYRLYGSADFELARLFHGLPVPATDPLMHLVVPAVELRIEPRRAILRATDDAALDVWQARLETLDRQSDEAAEPRRHIAIDARDADAEPFKQRVAAALDQIRAGAYDKVILSRVVRVAQRLDLVASYVEGRRANEPARSFLLRRDGFESAGFSPEIVLEVTADGRVSTQPLAGTRASGADADEAARLAAELLRDAKEIAEHAVSVRLALEELNQVCAAESVCVDRFMDICRRGSVQHLGSRASGRLDDGRTVWDAFRALFPAVTASGIPKREAIEAIGHHEPMPRGLYGGCVLISDDDGALDAALTLRSMYQTLDGGWLRAGAGIVAMSTPERELEETREKLACVADFLVSTAAPNR